MSTSGTAEGRGRRRADAVENRQKLIRVARDAFDADSDATLQSIARAAGVGQGTIYRHFPTRADLLVAAYRDDFDRLVASATELGAERPPVAALRAWLDELAVFGRKKHALAGALDAATQQALHDDQYTQIVTAITALLDAGARSGEIRHDTTADELLALTSFLWHLDTAHDPRIPRLLDLVMLALSAGTSKTVYR